MVHKIIKSYFPYNWDYSNKELVSILNSLLVYFSKKDIKSKPETIKYDKSKGICLFGRYGSGKSMTIKSFHNFMISNLHLSNYYTYFSSAEIEQSFDSNYFEALKYYTQFETKFSTLHQDGLFKPLKYDLFIDDITSKNLNDKKNYGTEINAFKDLFLARYDLFQNHGIKTHISTNLFPFDAADYENELRIALGERVWSRFVEMFQIVKFPNYDYRQEEGVKK